MRRITATLLMVGIGASALVALAYGPKEKAPAKSYPPSTEPVVLEVGCTGERPTRERWTVSAAGEWSHRGGWADAPEKKGKLGAARVLALAAHIAAQKFSDLPDHLGLPPTQLADEEPRHFARLTVGKKTVLLIAKDADFTDILLPQPTENPKPPAPPPALPGGDPKGAPAEKPHPGLRATPKSSPILPPGESPIPPAAEDKAEKTLPPLVEDSPKDDGPKDASAPPHADSSKDGAWSRFIALTIAIKDAVRNSPPVADRPATVSRSKVTPIESGEARIGDTWETLSRRYFGDERFADALRQFNKDYGRAGRRMREEGTFAAGETIYFPPSTTLVDRPRAA